MGRRKIILSYLIVSILFILGCESKYTPEEEAYIESIEKQREEKDLQMESAVNSPFNLKEKVEFHPLKYFDVDPSYVFKSKLHKYDSLETIIIFGSKGEQRKVLKIGYLEFSFENKNHNLYVYKSTGKDGNVYYAVWFTDLTTNKETYGVGRYLDFEIVDDPDYEYTIDFNLAYNPYCAYSSAYSCAIPTKEDHLDLALYAGEKKFHD